MMAAFLRSMSFAIAVTVAFSAQAASVDELSEALRIDDMIGVMRAEGLAYGDDLARDMMNDSGGTRWDATVARVYDAAEMTQSIEAALTDHLAESPEELDLMVAFFGSDLGQRILSYELATRSALLEEAVEDAAEVMFEELAESGDHRVDMLRQFADANDLIESNVMGALNANIAFYRGLAQGDALGSDMTEQDMVADVWSQEADIRSETEDWLFPYLALAYEPLTDEEIEAYIAFSATDAGQALNAALFDGFDRMFSRISYALGVAVAERMKGEDI